MWKGTAKCYIVPDREKANISFYNLLKNSDIRYVDKFEYNRFKNFIAENTMQWRISQKSKVLKSGPVVTNGP